VDRIVGLDGVREDAAMIQTPDGNERLELVSSTRRQTRVANPHAPANTPGIRHIPFAVETSRENERRERRDSNPHFPTIEVRPPRGSR
jgi:hypothetical protein